MPRIRINGVERDIEADAQMPLLWAIRDIVRLTARNSAAGSARPARAPCISMARWCGPA